MHRSVIGKKVINETLANIFKFISLRLTGWNTISNFKDAISAYQKGYYVDEQDALIVRNMLEKLQLITSELNKDNIEVIQLTRQGRYLMDELNS